MQFLRSLSFVFSHLCLLVLFFLTGQSYAMLQLSKKQITYTQACLDRTGQRFVEKLPSLTLADAGEKFKRCSQAVKTSIVRMVPQEDSDNDNKFFLTVFFLATTLPVDIQLSIVKKELLHGNESAASKFWNMPIDKALEWYAMCQEASRGKLIYLPIFEEELRNKGLVSVQCPLTHAVDLGVKGFEILLEDGFKIATLDANKCLNGLYNGNSSCCDDALNNFLDDTTGMFFQLSMQDILLLMNYGDKKMTINDLKVLVAIDKVAPFLKVTPRTIHYIKEYSRADVIDFIKIGAKNGMKYVFPVLAMPLCCAGLSKLVEINFCQKICSQSIAQDNAHILEKIGEVDQFIKSYSGVDNSNVLIGAYLHRNFLLNQLDSPVSYSLVDSLKMGLPLLLSIPIGINTSYQLGERDWLKKGLFVGAVLSVMALNLADCSFVQDSKSFAITISAVGALSLLSGILSNVCEEFFSHESKVNSRVNSDAIEALLNGLGTKKTAN